VFLGLRDQEARKLREQPGGDMAGSFIAEGDLVIERAIHHGYTLQSVLISGRRTKPLPQVVETADIFEANDAVLTAITGRPELRDPLSCFLRPEPTPIEHLLTAHRSFAVLENVNNPNNLGVIMRNAAGLGIDAVLLDPTCGDPLYRRAVRASMGQVFALPHARMAALPQGLEQLHEAGVTTIALTPSGEIELRDMDRPDKVAIVLGAEGPGLTAEAMHAANHRVRIGMRNDVDSLNVANAAAIAFHHFAI
jgi:tRNA G18 (ribose-2'-O)-methylase SpoU